MNCFSCFSSPEKKAPKGQDNRSRGQTPAPARPRDSPREPRVHPQTPVRPPRHGKHTVPSSSFYPFGLDVINGF